MRTIQLKCNNCGGRLDVDQDRTIAFCSYCGEKMLVDDEVVRQVKEENININDKAKVKEAEAYENVRINSILAKAQAMSMQQLMIILGCMWGTMAIIGIIIFCLLK
jgi:DNA-directed RNA polymerase subunit RPC12/RpoP